MVQEKISFGSVIRQKSFLLLLFLILNSVTWLFLLMHVINFIAPASISQFGWVFYLTVLIFVLIGPLIAEKINKIRFLFIWVLLGVISSLSYTVLPSFDKYGAITLLIFWGFSFGIGFPSCLSLIPSLTKIEERGRAGGTILFTTYAILPLLLILTRDLDIFSSSLMLAGWRSLGFGAFLLHVDIGDATQLKPVSYRHIAQHKTFLLYLLPWLAFCLINYFEIQVFEQLLEMELMTTLAFVIGCFSCVISGWLIDLKGRKRMLILALVMLGLGYVLLSFFPFIPLAQAFYMIVDGIAFGIITVTFMFVVWGDIADGERGEKFYAVGLSPFPIAIGLSTLISPWLVKLGASSAFSLASFFLFLAVIPIFFAPELLPEKVVKERELRKYMEEAKKVAGRG